MRQSQPIDMVAVEARLEAWARWSLLNAGASLGYPKASLFALMAESGGVPQWLSFRGDFIPIDYTAEVMERLMRALYQYNPLYARCIKARYLGKGKYGQRAKRLGLPYSSFKRYIHKGKEWLMYALCRSHADAHSEGSIVSRRLYV